MISPEYAAGFFDGEGCVGIGVRGKNNQVFLRATIVNTDENILGAFQITFGGNLNKPQIYKEKPSWKPFRSLTMPGRTAIDFFKIIYPYTKLKKSQIELAFEFWEFQQRPKIERCTVVRPLKDNPSYTTLARSPETLAIELEFKNRMHGLNAKGILAMQRK